MTLTIETEPAVVAELQAQRITDLLVQRADSPQDPVLYERLQAHGSVEVTASAFRDEAPIAAPGCVVSRWTRPSSFGEARQPPRP